MARLITLALATAVVAAGFSIPAQARGTEKVSATVRYDDLNLSSASGRDALKARVRTAVRNVCRTDGDRSLAVMRATQKCEQIALKKAKVEVAAVLKTHGLALAERGERTSQP